MSAATPANARWTPFIVLTLATAALSAAGVPTPKTVALLGRAGIEAPIAGLLLHAAPVLLMALGWFAMRALARGRKPMTRGLVYALSGGVIGFLTAFCLDLFAGVLPALERFTGPLRESGRLDIAAWATATLSFVWAALMALAALFGAPALRAMAIEGTDPEALDVRRRERLHFLVAAVGMTGQGVFVGALAVAHQLDAEAGLARFGVAATVAAGAAAFAWSSWTLWRDFDEMQRRATVEAYAWSGFIASIGCLVWATLESLSLAPPLSAYGAIVALVILQTGAALAVSASLTMAAAQPHRSAA